MNERPAPLTPRHRLVRLVIAWLFGMLLAIAIFFAALFAIFALAPRG
jgi:hypothetical protein